MREREFVAKEIATIPSAMLSKMVPTRSTAAESHPVPHLYAAIAVEDTNADASGAYCGITHDSVEKSDVVARAAPVNMRAAN
jgi:hypothetical protein